VGKFVAACETIAANYSELDEDLLSFSPRGFAAMTLGKLIDVLRTRGQLTNNKNTAEGQLLAQFNVGTPNRPSKEMMHPEGPLPRKTKKTVVNSTF